MTLRTTILAAALAASLSLSACGGEDCISGVGVQGIKLGTRDSITGVILDDQVLVTVVRLDPKLAPFQSDSLQGGIGTHVPYSANPLRLADTYGTYRLTIHAEGYRKWTREVAVELGCGRVITVEIIARLQPI